MPISEEILRRLDVLREAINSVPFIVLVWGPSLESGTLPAVKRQTIREFLGTVVGKENVLFSEDPELQAAIPEGEFAAEFMEASVADAVIIIAESIGSMAESALYRDILKGKTLVFRERRSSGFARNAQTILNTDEVEPEEWKDCKRVRSKARDFVEQLRIEKFRKRLN